MSVPGPPPIGGRCTVRPRAQTLAAQVGDAIADARRGKPLAREINSWMQAHPTGS